MTTETIIIDDDSWGDDFRIDESKEKSINLRGDEKKIESLVTDEQFRGDNTSYELFICVCFVFFAYISEFSWKQIVFLFCTLLTTQFELYFIKKRYDHTRKN